MAISTVTIALSPSTVAVGQPTHATLTITNDATACNVVAIIPKVYIGAAANIGNTPVAVGDPPNLITSLAGSGSTTVYGFDVIGYVPQFNGASTATIVVGADVVDSSGKVTGASTANLTVNRYP